MALSSGDMLYYDGTQWVNSSTIVSSLALEVVDSNNTGTTLTTTFRHKLSSGLSLGANMAVGIQFSNEDGGSPSTAVNIGKIHCAQSAVSPVSSYYSFFAFSGGSSQELLRLGRSGSAPGVFLGTRCS